ncbi:spermidine synthase [Thermohalobacter berrensis]|uniref:Spermidine synthase n=1 Tax=Thermohalobacter berrensis TaxID=99594 RepID=A0A419TAX7_9FIRM|nr:spermidine synthase [Thermohalobacter berrensis]RKD34639.1 hypothetical protein BET03_02090 [Thermohalobacter berrensis]
MNALSKDKNLNKYSLILSLFFVSSSLFIYEVLTTRLFSTVLVYHFVFLVTSLSILGLGIGAIIVFLYHDKFNSKLLTLMPVVLAISYIVCTLIIYKLPYIKLFLIYSVLASLPFVLGGIILSLIFKEFKQIGHLLYFGDLLGSSFGSIGIILLMDNLGFIGTLFVVSIMALLGGLFLSIKKRRQTILTLSLLTILLILSVYKPIRVNIEKNFTAYFTSPHTAISYFKQNKELDVKIEYTKWDSISRTDVIDVEDPNRKVIITDGGASAPMVKFNGDLREVSYLKESIEYIPFKLGKNDNTLIIGSGGGQDVLLALLGNAKKIDAVEINPSTIDAVKKYKKFNGGIYNLNNVKLYIEDGRKFIEKTEKKYNHIYLGKVFSNVVDYSAAMLSENYIYTEEAYKEYFDQLKDDGILTFVFNDIRELIKSVNTAVKVLMENGIKKSDITKHFILIENKVGFPNPVAIYKKSPFTRNEVKIISEAIKPLNIKIVSMPYISENPLYNYYQEKNISYGEFIESFDFNARPAKDNRPFFYDYTKGLPNILLYMLLGILIVAGFIFVYINKYKQLRKVYTYFSLLGLAFMLIEIPLIQKTILFIGSTTRAFSFILFSLLFSSGIGSFLSESKIIANFKKKRDYIFLMIPIVTVCVIASMSIIFRTQKDVDIIMKFFMVMILMFPLGLFLGMPFPKGIKSIATINIDRGVPLAWGINGLMSVAGSVLSLAISMKLGFNYSLILGGLLYFIIFIRNPLKV